MGDDPKRLFVGQLPMDIQEEEVRTVFNTYGTVEAVKIFDAKPPNTGKCALVTYDTEQAGASAIQVLNETYKFRYDDEKPCIVKYARGRAPGESYGGKGAWGGDAGGGADEDPKKVFVGQLPMDITEDEIRQIFQTYGAVTEVKIIDGKPPGSQKCAFVGYEADAGSRAAVQVLSGVYKFRVDAEKPIRVELARGRRGGDDAGRWAGGGGGGWDGGAAWPQQPPPRPQGDQKKIFAGNLPMDIREDEVRTIFGTYGTVTDVSIIDGKPAGTNKCAFVTYDNEPSAASAIQVLNNVYKFRADAAQPIRVAYTKSSRMGGGDWGGGGGGGGADAGDPRKVFVGQLPADITEDEIRTIFKTYGEVTSVYLVDGKGGTPGKVAFVEYESPQGAQQSIAALNDTYKFRFDSENPIRVSIARPKRSAQESGWDTNRVGYGGYDQGGYGYDRGGGGGGGYGAYGGGYQKGGGYDGYGRRDDYSRVGGGGDWGKGGGGGKGANPPSVKLHVGNLPPDIQRDALEAVFSTYGPLTDVHIMSKGGGTPAAAFVCYTNEQDAGKAKAAMDQGYEIRPGQGNINVQYARARGDKGGGRYQPY